MTIIYGGNPPSPPPKPKDAPRAPDANTLELVVSNRFDRCKHVKYQVDAKTRTVECRDCGAIVDPFDAIMQFAEDGTRATEAVMYHKRAVVQFQQEEDRLKKIVAALKTKLKEMGIPRSVLSHYTIEQLSAFTGVPCEVIKRGRELDEYRPRKRRAELKLLRRKVD